jgi:excisionase family DNA binding protein
MTKLYTVSQAANELDVNKQTVQRWLSKGSVKFVQVSGGWRRIPEKEIKRLLGVEWTQ